MGKPDPDKMIRKITTRIQKPDQNLQAFKIDHVVAGGASDGKAAVFLDVSGDSTVSTSGTVTLQSAWADSITTPAKGDMVLVSMVNNAPFIQSRIVGVP